MAIETPPLNTELFALGMVIEAGYVFAAASGAEDAYLDALRETAERYRLNGGADDMPDANRRMLEQLQPLILWWDAMTQSVAS